MVNGLAEETMRLLQQQLDLLREVLSQRVQINGDNCCKTSHISESPRSSENQSENLRHQKLTALAEFAAGAAHEINNPLAVISGNAQFLLGRETDLERRETLQKIIKQTQRISGILTDVLHFARPAAPKKNATDAAALLRETAAGLQTFALERKVKLVCPEPAAPIPLLADHDQVSRALSCLLRNAIEAAPEGGWAGIRIETPKPDLLHFVIEDSGSGPNPAHREALFDPFFSGRDAGRGRGLGLPIAWRLAQLNGGDVFLAESGTVPSRFVLSLPLIPISASPTFRSNGTHEKSSLPPLAITG